MEFLASVLEKVVEAQGQSAFSASEKLLDLMEGDLGTLERLVVKACGRGIAIDELLSSQLPALESRKVVLMAEMTWHDPRNAPNWSLDGRGARRIPLRVWAQAAGARDGILRQMIDLGIELWFVLPGRDYPAPTPWLEMDAREAMRIMAEKSQARR